MEDLQNLIGYNHIYSTPYHPQTNGIAERFNATFVAQISKLQKAQHNNWDEYLQAVVFAYNTGVHKSTKFFPYELLYDRTARLPIHIQPKEFTFLKPNDYFEQLKKTLRIFHQASRDNILCQQQAHQAYYNKNRLDPQLKLGDKVFTRISVSKGKLDPKFSPIPKIVVEIHHPIISLDYRKIIYDQQQFICDIRKNIRLFSRQHIKLMYLSIDKEDKCDREQNTVRHITKDSASFLWFQLIVDILKHMPTNTESAISEMLDECRRYYKDNLVQLEKIQRFQSEYKGSDDAIFWYTSESFLYMSINRALRSENIDELYTDRFFIIDLCTQLSSIYKQQRQWDHDKKKLNVYRGQVMCYDELEKLKLNIGNLISTNSFFSTTTDINVARMFAPHCHNKVGVLFQIEVENNLNSIIYADITKYSRIPDEKEVLFHIGAVFQIINVSYDNELHIWSVHLSASDDDKGYIEQYLKLQEKELKETDASLLFGRILIDIAEYSRSEIYFRKMLNALSRDNHQMRSICYQYLGRSLHYIGKLDEALHYYELAKHIQIDILKLTTNIVRAYNLFYLGCINVEKSEYNSAMTYFQDALHMEQLLYKDNDHRIISSTLRGIAWTYEKKGDYNNSLKYHRYALEQAQKTLPGVHSLIGDGFYSISNINHCLGNYKEALNYALEAFRVYRACVPKTHRAFGDITSLLGDIYYDMGNYDDALNNYEYALNVRKNIFNDKHPLIAQCIDAIGRIHRIRKEYDKALDYHQQSLEIFKQNFTNLKHPSKSKCLFHIGNVYEDRMQFADAYSYYQQSLAIRKNLYNDKHPSILQLDTHITHVLHFEQRKEYDKAIDLYRNILSDQKSLFQKCEHPHIALTLYNLGLCYHRKKYYNTAYACYQRAITMQKQCLHENHPSLSRTLQTIQDLKDLMHVCSTEL
ncbi:unnamed protein product [Rotaria sp. Silwood2]|nr:unnamed protein product [Rotaria sp. Silwood2]